LCFARCRSSPPWRSIRPSRYPAALAGAPQFLPYVHPVSKPAAVRLQKVVAASRRGHYPVKVALISGPSDLGVVPGLFGQPQNYARFMTEEMRGQIVDPVLVVMPDGLGFAVSGRPLSLGPVTNLKPGPTPDDLASAASTAIPKLAQANGHTLSGLPPDPRARWWRRGAGKHRPPNNSANKREPGRAAVVPIDPG
jgi:hypothetical protein